MKKRLLSILLALCMALTLLPGTVWATENSGTCGDNLTWSYSDGTLTIQGTGDMGDGYGRNGPPWSAYREQILTVSIGNGVTSISDSAFSYCTALTSVTIPASVTSIGKEAFYNCRSLISATIPNGVTSIGDSAFAYCNLTSVTIPNGVTSIGDGVFLSCESLISVTIPDSVTSIGVSAFIYCRGLTSVTIPDSVTSIETFAFRYCSSLTSITIPASVTSIGESPFSYCDSLASINVADGNPAYTSVDGVLFDKDQTILINYPIGRSNTSYQIPDSVTEVKAYAFGMCSSLTSVTIPSSVTTIDGHAFYECSNLTDVYYGGSESQWEQIFIEDEKDANDPLVNATIHYNSYNGEESDQGSITPSNSTLNGNEYIYDTSDLGADIKLDASRLNSVTDPASAADAVRDMVGGMTREQKESPTGIDLATLYAETAVAKATSKPMSGPDILISTVTVADVAAEAAQALSAVENALANGGIATARELPKTVAFTTNMTSEITIRIDPDILGTEVDKVRVETPDYALTFKLSDLAPDLTSTLTFKAASANAETLSVKNAVDIEVPGGSMAAPITVSLPTDKSTDTTYQAVVSSTGTTTASKYNPATTNIDGKVNASGTYTVEINEMDFTDITNKSTEMQKAIKYLAAHGIVMGSGGTNYSPNDSISRAELTALVLRALGKVDSKATPTFTDVTTANWYYATAASSQKLGYITGFEDNTFRGTTTINKEQIVVVAARVLGGEMNYRIPSNPAEYLSKYSDTVVSWAQPQVALATRENLVVYRTDGTFSGAKDMTRGDAAIIIYRLFQRIW